MQGRKGRGAIASPLFKIIDFKKGRSIQMNLIIIIVSITKCTWGWVRGVSMIAMWLIDYKPHVNSFWILYYTISSCQQRWPLLTLYIYTLATIYFCLGHACSTEFLTYVVCKPNLRNNLKYWVSHWCTLQVIQCVATAYQQVNESSLLQCWTDKTCCLYSLCSGYAWEGSK